MGLCGKPCDDSGAVGQLRNCRDNVWILDKIKAEPAALLFLHFLACLCCRAIVRHRRRANEKIRIAGQLCRCVTHFNCRGHLVHSDPRWWFQSDGARYQFNLSASGRKGLRQGVAHLA